MWGSADNFLESVPSFYHVHSGCWSHVLRLGNKCPYILTTSFSAFSGSFQGGWLEDRALWADFGVSVVGSCWNQACLCIQAAAAHSAKEVPQEGWESQSLTQAVGNHRLVGFAFNPNSSDHKAIDDTAEWTTGNVNMADQFLVWGSRGATAPVSPWERYPGGFSTIPVSFTCCSEDL